MDLGNLFFGIIFLGFRLRTGCFISFSNNLVKNVRDDAFFVMVLTVLTLSICFGVILGSFNRFYGYLILERVGFVSFCLFIKISKGENIEGLLKYFLVNSIASVFLLFSIGFNFLGNGSVRLYIDMSRVSSFSHVFFIVGLFVKMGLIPFSVWRLDLSESLPLFSLFYILVIFKIPYFCIFTMWILAYVDSYLPIFEFLLFIGGSISILGGAVYVVSQFSFKRFLASASFVQMGYIFLCFSVQELDFLYIAVGFFFLYCACRSVILYFVVRFSSNHKSVIFLTDLKHMSKFLSTLEKVVFVVRLLNLMLFPGTVFFFLKLELFTILLSLEQFVFVFSLLLVGVLTIFYYVRLFKIIFLEIFITDK